MRARAASISGARCGSSSMRRSSSSWAAGAAPCACKMLHARSSAATAVVAALHLRIQAQGSFQIAAPLRDQSQVIEGIVEEFAHGQQFGEAPARRIELAVLKFDQPQEAQRRPARTPDRARETRAERSPRRSVAPPVAAARSRAGSPASHRDRRALAIAREARQDRRPVFARARVPA